MSDTANQEKPSQAWIHYRPSQALLVSASFGAVLLIMFLSNWTAYRSQPHRVAWSDYMQTPQCISLSCLWLLICGLTYWLVRLWNEELPTDDASIESAWQAGMRRLKAHGQSLDQKPLFLVLGTSELDHQRQLLHQSGLALIDEHAPRENDAPLRWAFTEQGIWLFLPGAGTYSSVQRRLMASSMNDVTEEAWNSDFAMAGCTSTDEFAQPNGVNPDRLIDALHRNVATHDEVTDENVFRETCDRAWQSSGHTESRQEILSMVAANGTTNTSVLEPITASGSGASGTAADKDTLSHAMDAAVAEVTAPATIASSDVAESTETNRSASEAAMASLTGLEELVERSQTEERVATEAAREYVFQTAQQPGLISSVELVRQQHTLREVCRRLRSCRGTVAPANGIMACVSSEQLLGGSSHAVELGLALRADLQLIQQELQLQMPTTIMVDGLESLAGTSELIRRDGPEVARSGGLGASFPIRNQPEKPLVAYVCRLAVAQIESSIYKHLHASDILKRVGNSKLFTLLIECRSRLLPALQTFAGEAVGVPVPSQASDAAEPSFFSGVQFAASGASATEQAWVRHAFEQTLRSQNYLMWTNGRLRRDRQLKFTISVLKATCCVLIVALVVTLWL